MLNLLTGPASRRSALASLCLLAAVALGCGLAGCGAGTEAAVETVPPTVEHIIPTVEPTAAATEPPPPPPTPVPAAYIGNIIDLLDEGKLEMRAEAQGINSMDLELQNLTDGSLDVEIPAGTFFISSDSVMQNMVVRSSQTVRLDDQNPMTVLLEVACANIHREIPGSETGFEVRRSPMQAELERLLLSLELADAEYDVEQAAIWIVTDNASYEDLGILVRTSIGNPLGSRAIGYDDAARAMQFVDEAGIDISRKAIWNDREEIAAEVEDSQLARWIIGREGQAGAGSGAPVGEVVLLTEPPTFDAAFVPDTQQVVSSSCLSGNSLRHCTAGEQQVWDSLSGELLLSFGSRPAGHAALAFSPDGSLMASAACDAYDDTDLCVDGVVELWDTGSWEAVGLLEHHPERVEAIAFTPDAGYLAAKFCAARNEDRVCTESAIWVWDVAAREVVHRHALGFYSSSLAISPDGRLLAAPVCTAPDGEGACLENEMWVWEVASGALIQQLALATGGWRISTGFSAEGDALIAVGGLPLVDGVASMATWMWDTGSWELSSRIVIYEGDLRTCAHAAFAPARELAAVSQCAFDEEGNVTASNILVWDMRSGASIGWIDTFGEFVTDLDISSDGAQVLARTLGQYPLIIWPVR